MIVYQSDKAGFRQDVEMNLVSDKIHDAYFMKLGRHPAPSEKRSWVNSMMYMGNVLNDDEIADTAGVSIEFQLPLASKRIDFILSGVDTAGKEQVVIVELKQWEHATKTDKDAMVRTRYEHGEQETVHPSYQAWSYAALLEDYNQTVRDEHIGLHPCAYLHNYSPDAVITHPFYEPHFKKAPVFLKNDTLKLRAFIKQFVTYGDTKDILYRIENGRIKPSKQLADTLVSLLKGNPEFILLDDQKVVYENAVTMAQRAKPEKKQVLIVEGGPGTGKSVVAINLLVELTKQGQLARYVSKNAAPRAVYTVKLNGTLRRSNINNLFGGTGTFIDVEPNQFDTLIVDEAHRLNFKSGLYQNLGDNQALELMKAAKCTIFFIDNDQRVHIKDIGEARQLERWAKSLGAHVETLKLESQFRCNGSDGYLSWLDNTLQIRETANPQLTSDEFDFRVFNNPNELFDIIANKNAVNNKSRLVAGYCWDWVSKKKPGAYDIVLPAFNFQKKWNLAQDGSAWIIAPESANEIGCIHTCQGLELDYVGVIIGPDLRFENGRIVTDVKQRSGNDNSIKGIKQQLIQNPDEAKITADRIIKNTYRTLMTRGMKGCYVYCTDEALANHLESLLTKNTTAEETQAKKKEQKITPPKIRIEPNVTEAAKYEDFLPLYSIRAACGKFSSYETVSEIGWVKVENLGRLHPGMFVVQATGHSMEPKIHDGDLCVFRQNVVGSRKNKIVLVQHTDHFDSEHGGAYSIKQYTSTYKTDPQTGEWAHETITLQPLNKTYTPINLTESDEFQVIGEFLGVIDK
jgi:DUF2075 family protein/phage repressor protein C with HTH and peptisase S24 domain/predicted ATPase